MSEKQYSIRVSGPGLEMSKAVDEQIALSVLTVVMGDGDPQSYGVKPASKGAREADREDGAPELTVGEYLIRHPVESNPERIAGIAIYLRDYLSKDRVTRDELPALFQRAGEPVPKNLHRDLAAAIKRKLVAEDHERPGEYFATSTGEQVVIGGKGGSKRSSRSKTSTAASKDATDETEPKRSKKKRNATNSGQGPMNWLNSLIAVSFFSTHRSSAEIVTELARKGAHYKASDLTRQLQLLVQDGSLTRDKLVPTGSNREVWHYKIVE